jgi:hypothetical protein
MTILSAVLGWLDINLLVVLILALAARRANGR